MKIKDVGEFKLIEEIAKLVSIKDDKVIVGIGDDAAIVKTSEGQLAVLTTDILVEDVHFRLDLTSPYQLGYKSFVVNISDIAAMAALPRFALVSMALNPNTKSEFVQNLYKGMLKAANTYGVSIVGGDTTSSEKLIISVTIIGEVESNLFRLRSEAKVGDRILVTGELGASSMGLRLLSNKTKKSWDKLVNAHLSPVPRVYEARTASQLGAHAMEDISDGLIGEIKHICEKSNVGAKIYLNQLPITPEVFEAAAKLKVNAYDFALYGGEDYEIVFTAPPEKTEKIKRGVFRKTNTPVTEIGKITKDRSILIVLPDG
ncbi:MAG: thiamine-phosphate kinase, partial [Candidatus Subteraquimicrobiales bacterium]|nr:thiamine-phosphate kinase [Candidatus Subteraquimicrobiales bacterium]